MREVRYSLWERINDKSSSSERPSLSRPKRNASRQQLMIDALVFLSEPTLRPEVAQTRRLTLVTPPKKKKKIKVKRMYVKRMYV